MKESDIIELCAGFADSAAKSASRWLPHPEAKAKVSMAQAIASVIRGYAAQAIEARQGGDAKQAPSQDESAVGTMRPESTQGIQP